MTTPINPFYHTEGGVRAAAIYSGQVAPALTGAGGAVAAGSDVLLFSGNGRLNTLIPHATFLSLSGVAVNFYDAAAPVSGGPIAASGHLPLGSLPAAFGVSGQLVAAGTPLHLNVPFSGGLCVNSRSGQVGFTAVWTPENHTRKA